LLHKSQEKIQKVPQVFKSQLFYQINLEQARKLWKQSDLEGFQNKRFFICHLGQVD